MIVTPTGIKLVTYQKSAASLTKKTSGACVHRLRSHLYKPLAGDASSNSPLRLVGRVFNLLALRLRPDQRFCLAKSDHFATLLIDQGQFHTLQALTDREGG